MGIHTKRKRTSVEKVSGRKSERGEKGGKGEKEREGRERKRWRVVGKLKLFPDSEWKHFVAAPAAAGVSSFPVTAAHHARRGIR